MNTILLVVGIFFAFSNQSFAQVSEPLYIEAVTQFDIYPFINGSDPGLCMMTRFNTNTPTSVTFRKAPISTIDNPEWTSFPNTFSVGPAQAYSTIIQSTTGYQPGSEYIVQLMEVDPADGAMTMITPDNPEDDIKTMCTPRADGTLDSSCPYQTPVVSDCSPIGFNEALQNSGQIYGGITIDNIETNENSATLTIDTQALENGQSLSVVYTPNINNVTPGNFSGTSAVTISTNGGLVTVNLNGLQTNSTYYVSILNQAGFIVIDTDSNQAYETFTTGTTSSGGNSNGSSGGEAPNPATINVNLEGTFGNADTTGNFTQCGYGETYDCDFNQLLATIDRVIKFAIYVIVLPLAAILFAWSGIKLIIAQSKGKSAALSDAKSMFGRVLLGLVFALGAWVIVKFVLVILGYTDASGLLTQILGITT